MGDDLDARLTELQPDYDFADLPTVEVPARDYSSERGEVPGVPFEWPFGGFFVPAWRDFYAEIAGRLGDPLRERAP